MDKAEHLELFREEPEQAVVQVFDYAQADGLMFDEPKKEPYQLLKEAMKPYWVCKFFICPTVFNP